MIVDSSALVALLFDEPDAQKFETAIAQARSCRISAVNYVEAAIVVESQSNTGGRQFDALLRRAGIGVEPVSEEHAVLAGTTSLCRLWQR